MSGDVEALFWEPCRDFDRPSSCQTNDGTGLWCEPCSYRLGIALRLDGAAIAQEGSPVEKPTIDPFYCDCNYEPIRGIKAGRHLPSCRYGIIEDWLDETH